jgi:hypothetical protein
LTPNRRSLVARLLSCVRKEPCRDLNRATGYKSWVQGQHLCSRMPCHTLPFKTQESLHVDMVRLLYMPSLSQFLLNWARSSPGLCFFCSS